MRDIGGYETMSVLGSGQFGNVVLVRRNSDRKLFAAKIPHKEDAKQAARQEAQLLMRLHHVNIVQFVELVEDDTQSVLVMEYTSGGDLDAFLRWQQESAGHLSEPAIMRIFIQIVLALQYLHGHRILHRDLKPKNILLDGDGIVKLSDFGVSKVLQSSVDLAQTTTGTPYYMAPELLEGDAYDSKCDVWSLGCVLYELATFSPPFSGPALGAVVVKILHSEPPPISQRYSSLFRSLVLHLLEKDPRRRPDFSDILRCDAVQCHMMQLVSVATSHQPMLLEQIAARNSDQEIPTPLASPSGCQPNYHGSVSHDQEIANIMDAQPSIPKLPEVNHARQLFFENQAAARRNKERIDQEMSCAVFLDYGNDPLDQHAQGVAKRPSANPASDMGAVVRSASPSQRGPASIDGSAGTSDPPHAPSSLDSARLRAASYEELLNEERRRVQLETKALQERMRAMQVKVNCVESQAILQ